MRHGRLRRIGGVLALAVAISVRESTAAGETASWSAPVSGNWTDTGKWAGIAGYPNSPATDVMFAVTGADYSVGLSLLSNVEVNSISIHSANATVGIGGSLITDLLNVQAGYFNVGGGHGKLINARIQGAGTIFAGNLGTLVNVTLATNLTTSLWVHAQNAFTLDGGTLSVGHLVPDLGRFSAHFQLDNFSTISGSGTIVFDGNNISQMLSSAGDCSKISAGSLVIPSGITLVNGAGEARLSSASVANHGVINILPNRYFFISGSLVNTGTVTLNQGTLVFTETTSSATMGNFVRTGGDVVFNELLAAGGGNLDIDAVYHGPITLAGGTDATEISASSGSTLVLGRQVVGYSNFMDLKLTAPGGVTFSTNVTINPDAGRGTLTATGITLNNRTVSVSQGIRMEITGGKLDGSGLWDFRNAGGFSSDSSSLHPASGGTLTIGPGLTLRTNSAYPSSNLYIGGHVLNQGVISSESGRLLIESLTNAGTLRLVSGALVLTGTMQTSGFGNFIRTGGTLQFDGILLDNTGQQFTLDAAHGMWRFVSGTIRGGTVTAAGGSLAATLNNNPAYLDGVSLAGNFTTNGNYFDRLRVRNGLTLLDAIIPANLIFEGTQALGGSGDANLSDGGYTIKSGTLTVGPQVFIHAESGNAIIDGGTSGALVNLGTLSVNGRSLTLAGTSITNGGVLTAANATVLADATLNSGTFTASHSHLLFAKGLMNSGNLQVTGSTVTLGGPMANTGSAVLSNTLLIVSAYDAQPSLGDFLHTGGSALAASVENLAIDLSVTPYGPMDLRGATFTNATVSASTTTPMLLANATAQFNGSVLAATLLMQPGSTVNLGGGTLTLGGGTITMSSNGTQSTSISAETITGTGQVVLNSTGANFIRRTSTGSLTLDTGILVRTGTGGGTVTAAGPIVNHGTVSAETSGGAIVLSASGGLLNNGLLQARGGGSLTLATNVTNNGMMLLSGGVVSQPGGASAFSNAGTVALTGGTLSLPNAWSNTGVISASGATLSLTGPTAAFGVVNATSSRLTIATPVAPALLPFAGNTIVLNAGAAIQFNGGSLSLAGASSLILAGGGLHDVTLNTAGGGSITAMGSGRLSSVKFDNAVMSVQSSNLTISGPGANSAGTLGGSGTLVFNGTSSSINVVLYSSGLLIGPGMSVLSGTVGGALAGMGATPGTVTNHGLVSSRKSGHEVSLLQSVVNHGVLEAIGGGTMRLNTVRTNTGTIRAGAGSTVFVAAAASPNGFSNTGTLTADGGTLLLTGGNQTLGGTLLAADGGMFNFSSGSSVVTSPLVLSQGVVAFNAPITSVASITGAGTVTVAAGRVAQADAVNSTSLIVNGLLALRPNGTSRVQSVLVASTTAGTYTGVVDLGTSTLVVQASTANKATTLATLQSALAAGRNNGTWTGKGITSSSLAVAATVGTLTSALVLADNADLHLPSLGGQTLDDLSLLLTIAPLGDATLDWKVDAFDLNVLAAGWQTTGKLWSAGDFTGDGKVDAFDLNVVAARWQSEGPLEALLEGAIPHALAAVPEPGTLAVLGLGWAVAMRRRRRLAY